MQVVFIDEISMVGSGMFNFLDLRLQQIMGTKEPFGGLSMITVGDLFQLKPVFDHWIFENSKDGYTALATNLWQQYFQMFELSKVMRQREDKDFAEILNRVREGNHTEADIRVSKERILNLSPQHPDYPINSVHCCNAMYFILSYLCLFSISLTYFSLISNSIFYSDIKTILLKIISFYNIQERQN